MTAWLHARGDARRWGWLLVLTAACSTPGPVANDRPGPAFDRQSIALMRTHNREVAEQIRADLLRGGPLPPSAEIVRIGELDRINPSLSLIATQLGECEISPPIASNVRPEEGAHLVLQRGGSAAVACQAGEPVELKSWFETIEELGGELLIGLLAVGLVVVLAALPFLL